MFLMHTNKKKWQSIKLRKTTFVSTKYSILKKDIYACKKDTHCSQNAPFRKISNSAQCSRFALIL